MYKTYFDIKYYVYLIDQLLLNTEIYEKFENINGIDWDKLTKCLDMVSYNISIYRIQIKII